jgi:probable rRNA maturation factor
MPARFYEQDVKSGLKNKRKLSAFLDKLVQQHREDIRKTALSYIFCSDDYLLQMNQQYLDHNTLTDIITFDLSEPGTAMEGEIYISVERVRENAGKFSTTYEEELHRVIFHGALHLCGFKDKKESDKKKMREQENVCLEKYKKTA